MKSVLYLHPQKHIQEIITGPLHRDYATSMRLFAIYFGHSLRFLLLGRQQQHPACKKLTDDVSGSLKLRPYGAIQIRLLLLLSVWREVQIVCTRSS